MQMLQICYNFQTKRNKSASWSVGSAVWSHVYGGQSSQLPHGYWSPSHIMSAPASIRDVIMARVRTHPGLTMEPSSGSQSQSQHHSECSHSHWPHHFQRGLLINHAQCSGASPSWWHFCKYHTFYHLCCQLIIVYVYPKLSNFKINGFVGWKPSPENIHSALFPGQCCQECRRSSQQFSLWSIHMV